MDRLSTASTLSFVQSNPEDVAVRVDIPWQAAGTTPPDPARLSHELRVLWIVDQVRQHRVGIGKGTELAGLARAAFMRLLGEYGVPVIDYSVADSRTRSARWAAGDRRPGRGSSDLPRWRR